MEITSFFNLVALHVISHNKALFPYYLFYGNHIFITIILCNSNLEDGCGKSTSLNYLMMK